MRRRDGELTLGNVGEHAADAVDWLVVMRRFDQDGLFDSDPRQNPDAKLIEEAELSDPRLAGMAGDSKGELGRGGMRTKLSAAHTAARSGASTLIVHGRRTEALLQVARGNLVRNLVLRKP